MAFVRLTRILVLGYVTLVLANSSPEEKADSYSPLTGNEPREGRQLRAKQSSSGYQAQAEEAPLAAESTDDPIDRKDVRVQETNEVNPYRLFPPGFREILDIPLHQYSNGTTYHPSDKYKPPKTNKYPLVSSGYAKVQGTSSKTSKSTVRPATRGTTTTPTTTTTASYDYDDSDYGTKSTRRPVTKRPQYNSYTPTTPKHEEYTKPTTRRPQYVPDPTYDADSYATKPPRRPSPTRPPTVDQYEPYDPTQKNEAAVYAEYQPAYEDRPEDSQSYPPVEEVASYAKPVPEYANQPAYKRPQSQPASEAPAYSLQKPQYNSDYSPSAPVRAFAEPGNQEDNQNRDIIYDYEEGQEEGEGGVMFVVNSPRPHIPVRAPGGPSVPSTPAPQYYEREPVAVVEKVPRDPSQQTPPPFKPSALFQPNFPADFGKPPNFGSHFGSNQRNQPEQQQAPSGFGYNNFGSGFSERPSNFYAPNNSPPNGPLRGRPEPQHQSAGYHASQAAANSERYPRPETSGAEYPRPPFSNGELRFPQQRQDTNIAVNPNEGQPALPNVLPQFRPTSNEDGGLQPRPPVYNRPSQQQVSDPRPGGPPPHSGFDNRPNVEYRPPQQQQQQQSKPLREAGSPNPLSSLSQAVASFFGRRSSNDNQKMSKQGQVAGLPANDRENRNPNPVTGLRLRNRREAPLPTDGFLAPSQNPDERSPAFYMYTSRGLEKGQPPFLVVGPRIGPPPEVPGAKLVHSVPVSHQPASQQQPILVPASLSRRQETPAALLGNRRESLDIVPIPSRLVLDNRREGFEGYPIQPRPYPDNRRDSIAVQPELTRPLSALYLNSRQPENPYQENNIRPPVSSSIRRPPPVGVLFQNKPGFENQGPKPGPAVQASKLNLAGTHPQPDKQPPQHYVVPPRKPLNPVMDIADPNVPLGPLPTRQAQPIAIKPSVNRRPVDEPSLANHRLPAGYRVPPVENLSSLPAPSSAQTSEEEQVHGQVYHETPVPSSTYAPLRLPSRPTTPRKPTEEQPQPVETTSSYVQARTTTTTTTTTTTRRPTTASRYNFAYDPNVVGTISKDTQKGESIAVVQPAYVLSYPLDKSDSRGPELFNLDAPFFPSVEANEEPQRNSQYKAPQTVSWYAVKGSETPVVSVDTETAASNVPSFSAPANPTMESGFLPVVPHTG